MRFICILLLTLIITSCCLEPTSARTLVKIGQNETISSHDLDFRIKHMPNTFQDYYKTSQGKKELLQQLVEEKLLYLAAKEKKIHHDQQIKQQINQFTQETLIQKFLSEELNKISVSNREKKSYWKKNKNKFRTKQAIKLSQIVVKNRKLADSIYLKLQKKSFFFATGQKIFNYRQRQTRRQHRLGRKGGLG